MFRLFKKTKEEPYVYPSTLTEDIKKVRQVLEEYLPRYSISEYYLTFHRDGVNGMKEVEFTTLTDLRKLITKVAIPPIKLVTIEKRFSRGPEGQSIIKSTYHWTSTIEEYHTIKNFLQNNSIVILIQTIELFLLSNEEHYELYAHIHMRFEDSIHSLYHTILESLDELKEVEKGILDAGTIIMKKLHEMLLARENEIHEIEELQKIAVRKSLTDRVLLHVEYIDKFIVKDDSK